MARPAITTPFWDASLAGGLSILGMSAALAYCLFAGPVTISDADWIVLTILINNAHFMASYRVLYSSRAAIVEHRSSTLYVPVALIAILVLAALSPHRDFVYRQLMILGSIYLAWHYTGQAWGMVSAFGQISGVGLDRRERRMIRFGMRILLVLHVLFALAGRLPPASWIHPITYFQIFEWTFYGVCGLVAISVGVGIRGFHSVRRRTGGVPVRMLLPWASIYLWYAFWYFIPSGFIFVQLAHALQYLPFPLRVEVNLYARQVPRTIGQKHRHALFAYLALVAAGATILAGAPLAARLVGEGWYSTPDARAIFMAFTNCVAIHHYFIDGAIWKLSNPKVRRELFRHLDSGPTAAPTGASSR